MKLFYTYIVRCADGSFYTGYTTDLDKRIRKHNGQLKGGAKYTLGKRPVSLVHVEEFETRSAAMKREYELKQLTHRQKLTLCNLD